MSNRVGKLEFGKTGLWVNRVAMGGIPIMRLRKKEAVDVVKEVLGMGINFIDTATGYGDSEEKIGEALKGKKREDLVIASKSPASDKKTFLEHVDLSLKRMGIDYIDIYQLHGVNSEEKMKQVMGLGGAYEGLQEAIERGEVRHAAFSSHHMPEAKKLMLTEKFEVVQIPFNFVETEPEKEIIPLTRRMNLGFIAMKPLGGGLLEDVNLAFRYLAQFPSIVPDPGIEKIEEMEEIIQIVEDPRPLSMEEKKEIQKIREELGKEFCHRCDYCQPCPQGIPISQVLIVKSIVKRMPLQRAFEFIEPAVQKARECTECEECIERCPYDLAIPELLKKNTAFWEKCKRKAG
jgi:predicted aldo/keto reductase-like oxidoreductase